jgi:hypothetical protein
MEAASFFTMEAREVDPLCLLCVTMTDSMMKDERWKASTLLQGELQEGFYRLKEEIYKLRNKDTNKMQVKDIPLDPFMSFALMHSIVQPFYRMKGHILLPASEKENISAASEDDIESAFYGLKDDAADLLMRLTKAFSYLDYGLQTLEEVFDIHMAVRQLKADNTEELTTITRNELNTKGLTWIFTMFDTIELYQEEYDFARRFYSCQFIHISDYKELKEKLLDKKRKKKVSLTLLNTIILYCMLDLAGRLYLSDAAQYFEKAGEELDTEDGQVGASNQVRDFFLKFYDNFRTEIKASLANNEVFMKEIERSKTWEM